MIRKHIIRYIYKFNRVLYIAICTLLLLMSILFFSLMFMNNSYSTLQQKYDHLAQEDFQFSPFYSSNQIINNDDISLLEQKYGFKSELLQYKLAESEGIRYKILKHAELINKPYFIYGGPAITDDDVIIDINSAKRLKLAVDDLFIFQEQLFRISGIASFPGQVQPNMSLTGYQHYHADQAMLISFSDEVYQLLEFEEKVIYGAVFEHSPQQLDQQTFPLLQFRNDNLELNGLTVKLKMNQMIAGISTGVLSSIIFIMLFMLIYKMVKDNEKYFGVLKGIGYNNKAIISAFIPFLLTFSIPILVGYIISSFTQEVFYSFLNQDIIVPYIKSEHDGQFALTIIIAFLAVIILQAIVMLVLLLKRSPIKMIQNIQETKLGLLRQKLLNVFNGMSGIRKLQIKYIISHPFVFILTLFSGFALAVQILLAFAIYGFPDKLVAGIKEQFSYRYDVRLSEPAQLPEHEAYTTYSIEAGTLESSGESKPFDLLIVHKPELQSLLSLKLYGKSNINITNLLNHGVIISKWTANKYNLEIGDIVTLTINDEPYEMAIAGVHKGLQGSEMYTSSRYYEKITNNRELLVAGFFTDELEPQTLVNIPIRSVTNQHEIIKSAEQSVEQYRAMSFALLIIGIILGSILFAIALYIVLQNGQKHMLLLKALGYTNKQVFTIVIDGYIFILLFGVVIARPYLSLLTTFLFDIISKDSSFYLPIESSGLHLSYLVIGVILFFAFISLFYKCKIRNMKSFTALMDE